jgi:deaminated glutathione amidase
MSSSPVIVRHVSGERPAEGQVRIASMQYGVTTDVEANLAKAIEMIDLAAAERPDIVMTPEFVNHVSWYPTREDAWDRAITLDGPWIKAIGEKAREHGIWILINGIVRREGDRLTGSNLLFNPQGELAGQSSKQVLMGSERLHFDAADSVGPIIETPFGPTGMYSCMDGVINETPRSLALRGARVLLNTVNSFAPDEASLHVPVRAAENKVWVISANKVEFLVNDEPRAAVAQALMCDEDTLRGAGESMAVAPDGTIVARAPRRGDAILVVDIDPSLAEDKRRPDGTDIVKARRPEIYGPIAAEPTDRSHPAGAATVSTAVVQLAATGADAIAEAAEGVRKAVSEGALLVVLPELFCFDGGVIDVPIADAESRASMAITALQESVAGSDAVVVTSLPFDGTHSGVVVDSTGVIARQPQLHAITRHGEWVTKLGDGIDIVERPWGRLAVIVGDDAIFPESFRLAVLKDADVVAVPFAVQEAWEVQTGLKERAAENRMNLVAASQPTEYGASYFVPLTSAFGMWRADRSVRFDGRISDPDAISVPAIPGVTLVDLHPDQAINRIVTRDTDLVSGRPWKLIDALVS